jgi:Pyruvate/2-oxoacid:ferredoxin oxidoreductase gamma subunit
MATMQSTTQIDETEKSEGDARVYEDIRAALAEARTKAAAAVNTAMVAAYWEIGKKITEAVGERAEYGKGLREPLKTQILTI